MPQQERGLPAQREQKTRSRRTQERGNAISTTKAEEDNEPCGPDDPFWKMFFPRKPVPNTSYLLIHRTYIMSKLRRPGSQDVEFLFDQINVALNEEGTSLTPNFQELSQVLKRLKEKILDKVASKTIAAKEFNIKKATLAFGLQYRDLGNEYLWKIEDNVPLPNSATPSLGKVPRNFESCCYHTMSLDEFYLKYSRTFDRSTEASCRTPIDHILMECLGELVSIQYYLLPFLLNCEDF